MQFLVDIKNRIGIVTYLKISALLVIMFTVFMWVMFSGLSLSWLCNSRVLAIGNQNWPYQTKRKILLKEFKLHFVIEHDSIV